MMNNSVQRLTMLCLLVCWTALAFAGRPLTTEDASVTAKQEIQLEFSWEYLLMESGGEVNRLTIRPMYGLSESFQIGFAAPFQVMTLGAISGLSEFGTIDFSAKFRVLQERRYLPALAIMGAINTSPGATSLLASREWESTFLVSASKTVQRSALHLMSGYRRGLDEQYFFGVAAEYPLGKRLQAAVEFTGERLNAEQASIDTSALAGVSYLLNERIAVDGGIQAAMTDKPEWGLVLGFSFSR